MHLQKNKVSSILLASAALLLAVLTPLSAQTWVPGEFPLVNNGHSFAITALAVSEDGSTGFTADSGGIVKVWNIETGNIIQNIQTGSNPVILMAVHPSRPEIAIIEEGSQGDYQLSVWDWENSRMSFSRTIEDLPQFISYSPRGSFLTVGLPQWQSLRFYDTQRARELSYLSDGIGIVDFATVSGSESTVMTYSMTSGSVKYISLSNGNVQHETQTQRNLQHLILLPGKRQGLGIRDNTLYLVDLVTGNTISTYQASNSSTIISAGTGERNYYVIQPQEGRQRMLPVQVVQRGNSLQLQAGPGTSQTIRGANGLFSTNGNLSVFAGGEGRMGIIRDGNISYAGIESYSDIRAVTELNDSIYILTGDGISQFGTDVINSAISAASRNRTLTMAQLGSGNPTLVTRLNLPISAPAGMTALNESELLIWDSQRMDGLYLYDTVSETTRRLPMQLRSAVKSVRVGTDYIIVLDREDGLRLLDRDDYSQVFTYQTLGILDAIELSNGHILIGKNRTTMSNTSLLEVNPRTGETSLLNSPDTITYAFEGQGGSNAFYSIGVTSSAQGSSTVIRYYSQGYPDRSQVIMSFEGEDTGADMDYISTSQTLITSAGYEHLSTYRNRRLRSMESGENRPRVVSGGTSLAYGIDDDGIVETWNLSNGQRQAVIAALPNGDLILLLQNSSYLALETQPGTPLLPYERLFSPVGSGSRAPVLKAIMEIETITQEDSSNAGSTSDESTDMQSQESSTGSTESSASDSESPAESESASESASDSDEGTASAE